MDREEFIARLHLLGYANRFHANGNKMMFSHKHLPYVNVASPEGCRISDRSDPYIPFDQAWAHIWRLANG